MNMWAIFLVYASLTTPVKLAIPPSTLSFESNAQCIQALEALNSHHAFDVSHYQLVYAGCERVEPMYNSKTGVKL